MKEFNISDYSLFPETGNTVINSISELNGILNEIMSIMNELHSDDVFAGPISDSCYSGWKMIYSVLKSSIQDLAKATFYLNNVSSIYKMSDTNNANNIRSV